VNARHCAWAAAEAIRDLNHASHGSTGYAAASDVDAVIGSLHLLVQRLPQALHQAATWLQREHELGRIGHDQDTDPGPAVREVVLSLEEAVSSAVDLDVALNHARSTCTHLRGTRR
jgi:hypothetical protein